MSNAMSGISDLLMSILGGSGGLENLRNIPLTVSAPSKGNKLEINEIIGLPPQVYNSSGIAKPHLITKILQSTLVIDIIPALPKFSGITADTGLNLYTVDAGMGIEAYNKLFNGLPVKPGQFPIKLAVSFESPISESWETSFEDGMLEQIVNSASMDAMGEGRFITGQHSGSGMMRELGRGLGSNAADMGGNTKGGNFIGNLIGGLGDLASGVTKSLEKSTGSNAAVAGGGQMLLGSKTDFPSIWKSSSWNPSYNFKCVLINPFPNDDASYIKYIVEPLAKLLAFMCPISDSAWTFSFPLMCKVFSPGLFGLEAAYIKSITVTKGGPNNDISFYQRPNVVELDISFDSVYNTMIARNSTNANEDRPTLDRYLNDLRGVTEFPKDEDMRSYGDALNYYIQNALDQEMYERSGGIISPRNNIESPRVPIPYAEAFSDPILNPETISQETYSTYMYKLNEFQSGAGRNITVQDRIALQLASGVPVSPDAIEWFEANFENFDDTTKNILNSTTIMDSIEPQMNFITTTA